MSIERIREALADPALFDEGASVDDTLRAFERWHAANSPEAIRELLAERDALKVENEKLLTLERDVLSTLPGVYYMDPPDGGSVPLGEQVRRMAVDAARYRWLRDTGAVSTVRAVGDAGDPTYPDAERCAQTLEACEDDLLTEAQFVRWQGQEIERLTAALRAQPGPVSMDDVEWAGKVHLADCEARNQKLHAARTALVAAMEVVKAERERITQYDFVEPKRAEELDAIIAQADVVLKYNERKEK